VSSATPARSPSRLRLLAAQLRSPRVDRSELARLIGPDDLSAGWVVVDERTWRTGHQTPHEAWARRAVAAGCVTAWRSLRHDDRWLWVERVALALPSDVDLVVPELQERLLPNPRAQVRIIEASAELPPPVPGARPVWGLRQLTTGTPTSGAPALTLLQGYAVDRHLLLVCASGHPEWTSESLTPVVKALVARQVAVA
jgi:hypothetical protein